MVEKPLAQTMSLNAPHLVNHKTQFAFCGNVCLAAWNQVQHKSPCVGSHWNLNCSQTQHVTMAARHHVFMGFCSCVNTISWQIISRPRKCKRYVKYINIVCFLEFCSPISKSTDILWRNKGYMLPLYSKINTIIWIRCVLGLLWEVLDDWQPVLMLPHVVTNITS